MATFLQQLPPFAAASDPAEMRTKWRRSFGIYERACKYHLEDNDTRISLFLHVAGKEINEIYQTLTFPTPQQDQTLSLDQVLTAFDDHFKPYRNVTHDDDDWGFYGA
uniref:Uncharacterized protein n=1 Tax=Ornithodoros turicata TaxID=34597 RepID=A0A2R5LCZ0_9ACAR